MLKRYFNAQRIGRAEIKATLHGYHIRIRKRASIRQNIQTRLYLGDCKGRLEYDDVKIYFLRLPEWFDTLFEGKCSRDSKAWKGQGKWHFEEDFDPLSLPMFSRFPAKKIGIKRRFRRRELKWS